jgi:hypothetical protein
MTCLPSTGTGDRALGGISLAPGGFPQSVAEGRQDLLLDLLPGGGSSTGHVEHDIRIAVQFDEIVDVVGRKPAQNQPLGLQKDVHMSLPTTAARTV